MKWTNEVPKDSGFYWIFCKWKESYGSGEGIYVEHIEQDVDGTYYTTDTSGTLYEPEKIYFKHLCAPGINSKYWFLGPLKEPKKPKDI